MDIKLEEVKWFGLVSTFIGVAIFIVACSFDLIAGKMAWQHQEGLGTGQVLLMAMSGIYSMWALSINVKWKKYIWKIHRIVAEHPKVV